MKRLLLLLLVMAAVLAVETDSATGCEKYSDHLVCPQDTSINTVIQYTTNTTCFSMQNEYGDMEDIGCSAEAKLVNPLEYENCKALVPFGTDINISGINREYQCSTEKLEPGDAITVIGFQNQYQDCETVEADDFMVEYTCFTKGKKFGVNGTITFANNIYSIAIAQQKQFSLLTGFAEGLATPLMVFGVVVLGVYAWYIWSEKKKKN